MKVYYFASPADAPNVYYTLRTKYSFLRHILTTKAPPVRGFKNPSGGQGQADFPSRKLPLNIVLATL